MSQRYADSNDVELAVGDRVREALPADDDALPAEGTILALRRANVIDVETTDGLRWRSKSGLWTKI